MRLRMIAVGAALSVLSLAVVPAQACDDRYAKDCEPRVQADAADAGPAVNIKPTPRVRATRTARVDQRKKSRIALTRHRHRPAADQGEPPARGPVAQARQESAAMRRFRDFISPQSFVLNAVDELRKPRPTASHLAGDVADPRIVPVAWTGASEPDAGARAPVVAHDEANGDDGVAPTSVMAQGEPAEVRRAAADSDPPRMSFLSWFFVAWGGVLTVASALRMVVG